jgi:hypothetical protein
MIRVVGEWRMATQKLIAIRYSPLALIRSEKRGMTTSTPGGV